MTYSLSQQAFALSMMSNLEADQKGTAAALTAALASAIDSTLSNSSLIALMGSWTRVWGPVVWQDTGSDVADNAMFVAANADSSVYVVSIAGTNPESNYDWEEDFDVSTTVAWSYGSSGNVSQGTSDGLAVLLAMTDPSTSQTLTAFLGSVASASTAQLIITGHSLGGALSPALALAMFDTSGLMSGSSWELANVLVAPTAGPTPGDNGFTSAFQSTFPVPSSPPGFNQNVWNTLDLIPHVWAPATFSAQTLDNLYMPNLSASSCVQTAVSSIVNLPPSPNPYVQLPNASFAGTFQSPTIPFQDDTCAYLAQVMYQHIIAYYQQIAPELLSQGIMSPLNPFTAKGRLEVGYICNQFESKYCGSAASEPEQKRAAA